MTELQSCPHCGLVQSVPAVPAGMRACCPRCAGGLGGRRRYASNAWTAAIAAAGLILYPLAVILPIVGIEQFGHTHEASVLEGVTSLMGDGHIIIGLIVLTCSVILPIGKLVALVVITTELVAKRHRAITYRVIEWTGRWGMLDVLLVAILVAALKLGDLVTVTVGPGLAAFTTCVALSLIAAATFDPHRLWESKP